MEGKNVIKNSNKYRGRKMKIQIDREGCIECGGCESVCPEIFELDGSQKAKIVEIYRTGKPGKGEVKNHLKLCVEEAVEACPVNVISIE